VVDTDTVVVLYSELHLQDMLMWFIACILYGDSDELISLKGWCHFGELCSNHPKLVLRD
jgi:hypothetical protein